MVTYLDNDSASAENPGWTRNSSGALNINPLTAGHAFSRDRWSKSRAPVTRKCVTTFGPIKLSSGQ